MVLHVLPWAKDFSMRMWLLPIIIMANRINNLKTLLADIDGHEIKAHCFPQNEKYFKKYLRYPFTLGYMYKENVFDKPSKIF